jgi:hypothetical protein
VTIRTFGKKPPTIKPEDLVETPTGRTARCREINPDGSREFEDVVTGERFDLMPRLVRLLLSAAPRRWKTYKS